MISVYTTRPLPNGLERRRYQVTLTDLNGNDHVQVVGMFNHAPDNDGSEVEASLLASKKSQEVEQYKDDIREGVNPFQTRGYQWNTRAELLKPILDAALSLPATDALVYNGLPYLEFVTDEELMVLYQQDQAWVDNVRLEASNLLSGKTVLDAYVPFLGGSDA